MGTSGNVASDLGSIIGTQLESAAINAVFKGGTSLLTGGMRSVSKKAAEKERNTLFSRSSTKREVLEGMEQDVYMLHRTIARLINERTGVEHYYYAKEADMLRFEPICRNIMRGNFKGEEFPGLETEQIHKVLMMNPYELRIYCYVMKENGGITDELRVLMEYLSVDKASLANSYLEEKYNLDDYTTYDALVEFEKVVIAELEQFAGTTCDFSYEVAEKKEILYIECRTFRQFTYDTIEERDFAEEQFYTFVGDGFMELELDELLEKYEATYDTAIVEKNREDFRAMIMEFVVVKVDEFQDTESLSGYVTYAQAKKEEHQLENSELLDVFEKKYKKLERKEKLIAGAAAAKAKLAATAGNVMGKGKGLMAKLPFGKMKNEEVIEGTATEVVTEKPKKEKKKLALPGKAEKNKEQPDVTETKSVEAPASVEETPAAAPVSAEPPATKPCPQCGVAVKATGKFCSKCGYRF